jgi:hypothetical protein
VFETERFEGQVCDSFKLTIIPSPNEIIEKEDYFEIQYTIFQSMFLIKN